MKKLIILLSTLCPLAFAADDLSRYQVADLDKPQIVQSDILPLIEQLKTKDLFEVEQIGESFEQRPVFRIKVGHGPVKVLMWSQMHGDESTATPALFDFMQRIEQDSQWRASWFEKVTLYMIPMLNPDGAQRAQRYNAQGIDINRDAQDLQTPEGRILMQQAKQLAPEFGFNLHDQNRFYSAGKSDKTATISLLAPAFNVAKDIHGPRKRAMQVIGLLKVVGDAMIPGHLGRYNDTFAPRAFGDTLASMDISTILIESGAYPGDPNRQVARRVNLAMYSAALESIAGQTYQGLDLSAYNRIPMNKSNAFRDVIIDDLQISSAENDYQIDVALDLDLPFAHRVTVDEIGDLDDVHAFFRFDGKDWRYQAAEAYPLTDKLPLTQAGYLQLLRSGYGWFKGNKELLDIQTSLPVATGDRNQLDALPQRHQLATFFLVHQDGKKIAVIRGIFIDLQTGKVLNQYST